MAATMGHLEIVKLLVSHGTDLEAESHDLETPLHKAAKCNNVEVVEYLLQQGNCLHIKIYRQETNNGWVTAQMTWKTK